ncbi:MAG: hypothetical protein GY724_12225, partial [Actinomycetia bacterium]|nr:hypothetical protein [Actinomycetes bacterium]
TQIETLPMAEFLRRYLQHVPPPNYKTVRHYGLYTSAKQADHARCVVLLADHQPSAALDEPDPASTADPEDWRQAHTCPRVRAAPHRDRASALQPDREGHPARAPRPRLCTSPHARRCPCALNQCGFPIDVSWSP